MDIHEALAQIESIHERVAAVQTFRGYRASTVAASGLLAFVAAATQPVWLTAHHVEPTAYVQYWVLIAAISATCIVAELILRTYAEPSRLQRDKVWHAAQQFLPCVVAGGLLTWSLVQASSPSLPLLPGLWSIVFSLGVFASLPQLPRPMVLVGMHYLGAGVICLLWGQHEQAFAPWTMTLSFGGGQLLTAFLLYWTQERQHARR